MGTTRRPDAVDEFNLYLDLEEGADEWRCPRPIDVAVVCAGVSKIKACKQNVEATARVNVQGVSALAKALVARGAFVVYLSSNHVFEGSVPYRAPDDPVSPVTEYGLQKAEAERRISQLGDRASIVRFTKVLGPADHLFTAWSRALRNGEIIRPFSDMYMAPVPLWFAVSMLKQVADMRLPGILQVSGERDICYADAAHLGARLLGADLGLVQPVDASQSGLYMEPVSAHTTLDIERLKSELGMEPPDVWLTVEESFLSSPVLA